MQGLIEDKEEGKMIDEKSLFEIGKVLKPHGVKGEVTVLFNNPSFADIDTDFYFFVLEGMFIPFFIEDFVYNSDVTARIKFEGLDSIEQANSYSDVPIVIPDNLIHEYTESSDAKNTHWHRFIGYTVYDEALSEIGIIESVDLSTINALFVVLAEDKEILIPATQDFIVNKDPNLKKLYLKLPKGLL